MPVKLTSHAELEAKKAEALPAFGGLNLLHIKRQLAQLLQLIGREGMFDEYTLHDISHVDKMLGMLDWLIPSSTQKLMSPADWLLAVLGIYFHDLGMLVTGHEFANRESSGFPEFRDACLFAGEHGEDYEHKVGHLPLEQRDRFLYQEFVRDRHAQRIRWWIEGTACSYLGVSDNTAAEVDKLLKPLGDQCRRDLGLVAESHHLSDLENVQKYDVSQPYGDSDAETANLQYAAVLLRAADLLHITSDRTPAIAYRVLNPLDPLSQQEWAKQMAVKRVRSKMGTDDEGNVDPNAPRDTVEVHAYFTKEDGFFALTAYLTYAAAELAKCCDWIFTSHRKRLARHEFPWSKIDDSHVEAEDCLRDAFEFTIDQAKILDLLTGHTLYNDSSVVLRELVQNSLDAIRLRIYEKRNSDPGEVNIVWDSHARVLTVSDNGTGMSEKCIRDHLLRVGASLYQDAEFKKSHPGFSSISRFGIGVLSTFMVADSVEIITCHEDDDKARRLALRSVHGKYLVRLLEKNTDPAASVAPYGTLFKLRVRHSAKMPDVLKTARHWIVLPKCKVTVRVDDGETVNVGWESPKDAIVGCLRSGGYRVVDSTDVRPDQGSGKDIACVVQHEIGPVTVAYAVRWSVYFHEWSFLKTSLFDEEAVGMAVGTCLEGIRVDTNAPGYTKCHLMALANARGENCPKTNVARSGLEATPEREILLRAVYAGYCRHAEGEVDKLKEERGHSLTWAVQEAQYLLVALAEYKFGLRKDSPRPVAPELLEESIKELPVLLTESLSGREAVSCKVLQQEKLFWTVNCPLLASAEVLIRETPADASIRGVLSALGADVQLPSERVLCGASRFTLAGDLAFSGREIGRIVLWRDQRRLDLAWFQRTDPARWLTLPGRWGDLYGKVTQDYTERYREVYGERNEIYVSSGTVDVVGLGNETAIRHGNMTLLVGDNPATVYVRRLLQQELQKGGIDDRVPPVIGILALCEILLIREVSAGNVEEQVTRIQRQLMDNLQLWGETAEAWEEAIKAPKLISALRETEWLAYDLGAWERRSFEGF